MWHLEVRAGKIGQGANPRRMRVHRTQRGVVALLLPLLIGGAANTGCYSYVPISMAAVEPKQEVRVRVTPEAAARLSKELGVFSTQLEGEFTREGADSVSVGVPIDRSYNGNTIGTTTQLLFLGRSEVVEVRKREFSRSRTVLMSAGTAVGFGLLAVGVKQLVDPNGPSDSQPPPPPPPPSPLRRPAVHRLVIQIP